MVAIVKFADGLDYDYCREMARAVADGLDGGIVVIPKSDYRLTLLNDKGEVVYESNE